MTTTSPLQNLNLNFLTGTFSKHVSPNFAKAFKITSVVYSLLLAHLGDDVTFCPFQLHKAKSNKELWAFLFSDFLLLTHAVKQFTSSGPDKLFSSKNNVQLKMYKPVRETHKAL